MTGFWICLVSFTGFWYASGSKYARAQNMARLWICEGYTGWWIYLNKPEYALIMPQYAWICLNNAEFVCIYLNKQSSKYTRIQNVSDADIKQTYSEHCQTFRMERFAKRTMPECQRPTKNFSGQGRFRGTMVPR